jgi:hypothetical protein
MPSGTTVADPYAWDWSATTHDARGSESNVRDMSADLIGALGGGIYVPSKGLQGWSESVQVFDPEGYRLGSVYFGGDRTDVHVVSTSSAAKTARPLVASKYEAKTSRVDTCVDTTLSFDALQGVLEEVAGPQTKVTYMQSMIGGKSTGRTLYVGAPTSMVRVRLYEKWLESPGQYEEGTNRVEVQLRPPSRAKGNVSKWPPVATFCASKLTRRLADALETDVVNPGTLQKSKGTPDLERTLSAMGTQYGKAVRSWLDLSQGDIGRVLDHLDIGKSEPIV